MTVRDLISELMTMPLDAKVFKSSTYYSEDGEAWETRFDPNVRKEELDAHLYVIL